MTFAQALHAVTQVQISDLGKSRSSWLKKHLIVYLIAAAVGAIAVTMFALFKSLPSAWAALCFAPAVIVVAGATRGLLKTWFDRQLDLFK